MVAIQKSHRGEARRCGLSQQTRCLNEKCAAEVGGVEVCVQKGSE
jgi:hypothetical protein